MTIKFKYLQVLNDLYASPRGFYVYIIFRRHGMDTADAIRFVEYFSENGVVEFDQENIRVKLSEYGRKHFGQVIEDVRKMEIEASQSYLETIRCPQKPIFEPYVPMNK